MGRKARNKEQMAVDVEITLSSNLSKTAKNAVLRNVIWHWTLDGLKYKRECPLVSSKVCELAQQHNLPVKEFLSDKKFRKEWKFEHVVPINVLMDLLFEAKDGSEQRELLDRYAIACIVTKDEDKQLLRKTMPSNWKKGEDEFSRYRQAGIAFDKAKP